MTPPASETHDAVKSKGDRKAVFNAADKLCQLVEQLAHLHMKPLQGADACDQRTEIGLTSIPQTGWKAVRGACRREGPVRAARCPWQERAPLCVECPLCHPR